MKNKRYLVVSDIEDKRIKNKANSDVEIIDEKTCQVEYDTSKMQVFAVDGAFVHVDLIEGEARLLFFTNYSDVGNDGPEDKKKFYNLCVTELRMTPNTMRHIFESIADEMKICARSQKKKFGMEETLKKQGREDHIMFS